MNLQLPGFSRWGCLWCGAVIFIRSVTSEGSFFTCVPLLMIISCTHNRIQLDAIRLLVQCLKLSYLIYVHLLDEWTNQIINRFLARRKPCSPLSNTFVTATLSDIWGILLARPIGDAYEWFVKSAPQASRIAENVRRCKISIGKTLSRKSDMVNEVKFS